MMNSTTQEQEVYHKYITSTTQYSNLLGTKDTSYMYICIYIYVYIHTVDGSEIQLTT